MSYTKAWLSYPKDETVSFPFDSVSVYTEQNIILNAAKELVCAVKSVTGKEITVLHRSEEVMVSEEHTVFLTTNPSLLHLHHVAEDSFCIYKKETNLVIAGTNANGVLYGVFELLRLLQTNPDAYRKLISSAGEISKIPSNPLRMLNHWDNMDGSIERGYSGLSFFFEQDRIILDDRTEYYARLLASVGINATVINNVNVKQAATWLITDRYLEELKKMSGIFAGYGIKLYLSLNFAAPMEIGGLSLCDPLDKNVIAFWEKTIHHVYEMIPDFGGFLVKADSEGRPGPFTYGRNHADGANMLARIIAPYGGRIIWRCFVYNCSQDWRDRKTDRARAGYDNFMPLDGQFLDNVILQIKNGPMDFQVREAVSPLFSGLKKTNQMLEVQAAQEYTGQQRHLCYLIPMWKEVLDFKTYQCGPSGTENDTVADIVSGRLHGTLNCGMAAVINTGNDENWTGHDMAAANFYGFGRLAYDTSLSAEEIAKEWIICTYGNNEKVLDVMSKLLLLSWPAYEKYTSPLGIGWMVNPNYHYGPNVDGYEYDRWGTYHRSDCKGMGVDRTTKGTGYTMQYNEPNASMYENLETCPEELLLFFHHVPYTYRLKTGKTLIQHIYDTHFEGCEEAQEMKQAFMTLQDDLPSDVYERTLARFTHQAEHAKEWRDRINTYYFRISGIADEKGRTIY